MKCILLAIAICLLNPCFSKSIQTYGDIDKILSDVAPEYKKYSELITGGNYCLYQDLIINGEVIRKGVGPRCPDRYACLTPVLDKYQRPFTVLELGACNGYMSLRIAKEYDAVCVMIDVLDLLTKICELNTDRNNIIYMKHSVDENLLQQLAMCEHFDVVIYSFLLHHLKNPEKCAQNLLKLGDNIIVETPGPKDSSYCYRPAMRNVEQFLLNHPNSKVLGENEHYPTWVPPPGIFAKMIWVQNEKTTLEKKDWYAKPYPPNEGPLIISNFQRKNLLSKERDWIPGINLKTFIALNGQFPKLNNDDVDTSDQVMILQGNHIEAIQE